MASGIDGQAESIGRRLRRLRHERGLSQRDLASPGVSYAYISRIEAGARRPSVKALRKLARKLGVSADYLETGSEIRAADERELRIADAELELRLGESPAEAETTLLQLQREASTEGDPAATLRSTVLLGLAAARAGRYGEAIERLESLREEAPVSPNTQPEVYAALGGAYVATGRPELAVQLYERCLETISEEAPDDRAARLRIATSLGQALTALGEDERAQSVLGPALDGADGLADAHARVRLYRSLARAADLQGRQAAALDYVRRAIALLDATDDTLDLARAHRLSGELLTAQGRDDEAAPHLELAERLLGPAPPREGVAGLGAAPIP